MTITIIVEDRDGNLVASSHYMYQSDLLDDLDGQLTEAADKLLMEMGLLD